MSTSTRPNFVYKRMSTEHRGVGVFLPPISEFLLEPDVPKGKHQKGKLVGNSDVSIGKDQKGKLVGNSDVSKGKHQKGKLVGNSDVSNDKHQKGKKDKIQKQTFDDQSQQNKTSK